MCTSGSGELDIIVAEETDDGFTCWSVSHDATEPFCYEVESGKIIAIELNTGEDICNPNQCAEKALADCGPDCGGDDDRFGDSGRCGDAFLRACGQ